MLNREFHKPFVTCCRQVCPFCDSCKNEQLFSSLPGCCSCAGKEEERSRGRKEKEPERKGGSRRKEEERERTRREMEGRFRNALFVGTQILGGHVVFLCPAICLVLNMKVQMQEKEILMVCCSFTDNLWMGNSQRIITL